MSQVFDVSINPRDDLLAHLRSFLTPSLFRSVYVHKFPWPKHHLPSGATVANYTFNPSYAYLQRLYDLIYHPALLPLSHISLTALLSFDFTLLLPSPTNPDYPIQALGLITILDQHRLLTTGPSVRYTHAFFDPICEKLAQQLISLPPDLRPDAQQAWMSLGYTLEQWAVRTIWFWAPLFNSSRFMTEQRDTITQWLRFMTEEVQAYSGDLYPWSSTYEEEEHDICAFKQLSEAGPPMYQPLPSNSSSPLDPRSPATISTYIFHFVRLSHAQIPIIDFCGHYPHDIRKKGLEWNDKDREYMARTDGFGYDSDRDEEVWREIREDYLRGVWREMGVVEEFERGHGRVLYGGEGGYWEEEEEDWEEEEAGGESLSRFDEPT